ncbi:MAG: D-alanyl-D-alanine carboxypeptidase/D-alanyl-D-alanine-endopeptidase [Cyanobacteria bacterium RUI128]|nr:D-alanyl-D-alanine carboxypeptidase/D-alanyl-D-alanine-endopeptidase [Cyanobacteria bacterium RUI128]
MKKFLLILTIIFGITVNCAQAGLKSDINDVITKSNINKSSISISLKNASTGKTVYELNPNMPVSPASTQKIITATPAFMTLGDDYRFATKLYKNNKDEYLIVLGADPYLRSNELDKIVKFIPKEPACINIDASIIDDQEWGEGWQWDDDLNPRMPKFSAYNLDKNIMEIVISPSMAGYAPEITQDANYPLTFVNKIITSNNTKYTIKRQNHISPDVIILEGTICPKKSEIIKIPINNPKKYFTMKLSDSVIDHQISSSGVYKNVKLDKSYKLITLLSHDIENAKTDIYKNSSNFVAETVFKIAGGKYVSGTGSFENGLLMFNDFCKSHNIDTSRIKITDASGVSKNNLMVADFMTEFLYKTRGYIEPNLPTAGEGTLSNRMLYLKGFVHAKTGTLNNISAIAGYISTLKRQSYVFCIMINDPHSSAGDKKMLEEYILRTIYSKG